MARVYLAQAAAVRRFNDGRYERLIGWAQKRRRQHAEGVRLARERESDRKRAIAAINFTPVQGDLFEGLL
jgi:hypothetical protein